MPRQRHVPGTRRACVCRCRQRGPDGLASMPCGLCCGSHGIRNIRYCGIRGPLMRLGPGLTAWAVGTAVMMPLHSSYRRRLKSEMPMTLALVTFFSSTDATRMSCTHVCAKLCASKVRDRVSETVCPRPCVRDRVSEAVCPRPCVRDHMIAKPPV